MRVLLVTVQTGVDSLSEFAEQGVFIGVKLRFLLFPFCEQQPGLITNMQLITVDELQQGAEVEPVCIQLPLKRCRLFCGVIQSGLFPLSLCCGLCREDGRRIKLTGSDLLAEGLGTVQIEGAIPIGSEAAVPLIGIVDGNIVLFRLVFVQATRFMDAVFDPVLLAIEQLAITAELDFLLLSHDCLPPSP